MMADRMYRSAESSRIGHHTPSRLERGQPDYDSLSDSSSSSCLIDISRYYPLPRTRNPIRTFFTAPSERRRLKRRRSSRILRFSNSSSSSINTDLAYGQGYIKGKKRVYKRGRGSRVGSVRKKKSHNEEAAILATGAGLLGLARKKHQYDRAQELSQQRRKELYSPMGKTSGSTGERGINMSSVSYGSQAIVVEEDGWESASDVGSISSSSVDSRLAFGTAADFSPPRSPRIPPSPYQGWGLPWSRRRKSTVVDPSNFGPYNSLRGVVNEPVGFGDVDANKVGIYTHTSSTFSSRTEIREQESVVSSSRSLQRVYPVSTDDPTRFDVARSTAASTQEPYVPSRPAPVPLQQPQPFTPVSQSLYEPTYSIRSASGNVVSYEKPSSSNSLAGAALAGIAGAAIGGMITNKSEEKRERKREEAEESMVSRKEKVVEDSSTRSKSSKKSTKSRDSKDDRKDKRKEKSRDGSRDSKSKDKGKEKIREETREERRERRREERRRERAEGSYEIRQVQSDVARIDPFQYQVADDDFPSPDLAKRALTSIGDETSVFTVDREPDFSRRPLGHDYDSQRYEPHKKENQDENQEDSLIYRSHDNDYDAQRAEFHKKERHNYEREELREAESIYHEAEHSTAPVVMGAISAAVAAEIHRPRPETRQDEHRSDYESSYTTRDTQKTSWSDRERQIQEDADRAYREAVLARKIASKVIRDRTPSPDIASKYRRSSAEAKDVVRIVTPPGMDDKKKHGPYDAPNADFQLDHILDPRDLQVFKAEVPTIVYPEPNDFLGTRPLLNLVRPTPAATPTPEKQSAQEHKYWNRPSPASDVAISPKGEIYQTSDPDAYQTPTGSTVSKGVTWGANETKHFDVEDLSDGREESVSGSPNLPQTPTSDAKKASGWGTIAAGIIGASAGAAAGKMSNESWRDQPRVEENSENPRDYREVSVEPEYRDQYRDDKPPPTGPKPSSIKERGMPGAFNDDLDFTATLAAGLQDSGFDPNIVINDPTYHRRTSPPGSQISPNVVEEIPDTPQDLKQDEELFLPKPSKKEQRKLEKEAKRKSMDENLAREVSGAGQVDADIFYEPKLSKKEQKKRDKAAKRMSTSQLDDLAPLEETPLTTGELVEEPQSYFEPPKSKRSSKGLDSREDASGGDRTVSVPVNAFDYLREESPKMEEWEMPKKSGSKRDSGAYDSSSRSQASSSNYDVISKSSKSSESSKRRSEQWDAADPTEVSLPPSTPSETDPEAPRSSKESGVYGKDREVKSEVGRYDDERRHSRKSRSRGDDEAKSIVSASAVDDKKRSSGGFFGLFGSKGKEDKEVSKKSEEKSRDDSERKKKHRSSRDVDERSAVSSRSLDDDRRHKHRSRDDYDDKSTVSSPGNDDERRRKHRSSSRHSLNEKSTPDWEDFEAPKRKKKSRRSGDDYDEKSAVSAPGAYDDDFDDPKTTKLKRRSTGDNPLYGNLGSRSFGDLSEIGTNENETSNSNGHLKDESFLDKPDTLGAGVGIVSPEERPEAAKIDEVDLRTGQVVSSSLPQVKEQQEEEIRERVFRPSIDPQYGDLLPLPPSDPQSPSRTPLENLPELPESRPDTPEAERRLTWERTHAKKPDHTPAKSPSQSAVPIKFMLGHRASNSRASPVQSPVSGSPDALQFPKSRSRPVSWDGNRVRPLILVEQQKRDSGSYFHTAEQLPTDGYSQYIPRSSAEEHDDKSSPINTSIVAAAAAGGVGLGILGSRFLKHDKPHYELLEQEEDDFWRGKGEHPEDATSSREPETLTGTQHHEATSQDSALGAVQPTVEEYPREKFLHEEPAVENLQNEPASVSVSEIPEFTDLMPASTSEPLVVENVSTDPEHKIVRDAPIQEVQDGHPRELPDNLNTDLAREVIPEVSLQDTQETPYEETVLENFEDSPAPEPISGIPERLEATTASQKIPAAEQSSIVVEHQSLPEIPPHDVQDKPLGDSTLDEQESPVSEHENMPDFTVQEVQGISAEESWTNDSASPDLDDEGMRNIYLQKQLDEPIEDSMSAEQNVRDIGFESTPGIISSRDLDKEPVRDITDQVPTDLEHENAPHVSLQQVQDEPFHERLATEPTSTDLEHESLPETSFQDAQGEATRDTLVTEPFSKEPEHETVPHITVQEPEDETVVGLSVDEHIPQILENEIQPELDHYEVQRGLIEEPLPERPIPTIPEHESLHDISPQNLQVQPEEGEYLLSDPVPINTERTTLPSNNSFREIAEEPIERAVDVTDEKLHEHPAAPSQQIPDEDTSVADPYAANETIAVAESHTVNDTSVFETIPVTRTEHANEIVSDETYIADLSETNKTISLPESPINDTPVAEAMPVSNTEHVKDIAPLEDIASARDVTPIEEMTSTETQEPRDETSVTKKSKKDKRKEKKKRKSVVSAEQSSVRESPIVEPLREVPIGETSFNDQKISVPEPLVKVPAIKPSHPVSVEQAVVEPSQKAPMAEAHLGDKGIAAVEPLEEVPVAGASFDDKDKEGVAVEPLQELLVNEVSFNNKDKEIAAVEPSQEAPVVKPSFSDEEIATVEPSHEVPVAETHLGDKEIATIEPLEEVPVTEVSFDNKDREIAAVERSQQVPVAEVPFDNKEIAAVELSQDVPVARTPFVDEETSAVDPLRTETHLGDERVAAVEPSEEVPAAEMPLDEEDMEIAAVEPSQEAPVAALPFVDDTNDHTEVTEATASEIPLPESPKIDSVELERQMVEPERQEVETTNYDIAEVTEATASEIPLPESPRADSVESERQMVEPGRHEVETMNDRAAESLFTDLPVLMFPGETFEERSYSPEAMDPEAFTVTNSKKYNNGNTRRSTFGPAPPEEIPVVDEPEPDSIAVDNSIDKLNRSSTFGLARSKEPIIEKSEAFGLKGSDSDRETSRRSTFGSTPVNKASIPDDLEASAPADETIYASQWPPDEISSHEAHEQLEPSAELDVQYEVQDDLIREQPQTKSSSLPVNMEQVAPVEEISHETPGESYASALDETPAEFFTPMPDLQAYSATGSQEYFPSIKDAKGIRDEDVEPTKLSGEKSFVAAHESPLSQIKEDRETFEIPKDPRPSSASEIIPPLATGKTSEDDEVQDNDKTAADEVANDLDVKTEPVQVSGLSRKSSKKNKKNSKRKSGSSSSASSSRLPVTALSAVAIAEAAKKSQPERSEEPSNPEPESPGVSRKLSKKERKKKVVDRRSQSDDVFDDTALWEGKDPVRFDERGEHGRGMSNVLVEEGSRMVDPRTSEQRDLQDPVFQEDHSLNNETVLEENPGPEEQPVLKEQPMLEEQPAFDEQPVLEEQPIVKEKDSLVEQIHAEERATPMYDQSIFEEQQTPAEEKAIFTDKHPIFEEQQISTEEKPTSTVKRTIFEEQHISENQLPVLEERHIGEEVLAPKDSQSARNQKQISELPVSKEDLAHNKEHSASEEEQATKQKAFDERQTSLEKTAFDKEQLVSEEDSSSHHERSLLERQPILRNDPVFKEEQPIFEQQPVFGDKPITDDDVLSKEVVPVFEEKQTYPKEQTVLLHEAKSKDSIFREEDFVESPILGRHFDRGYGQQQSSPTRRSRSTNENTNDLALHETSTGVETISSSHDNIPDVIGHGKRFEWPIVMTKDSISSEKSPHDKRRESQEESTGEPITVDITFEPSPEDTDSMVESTPSVLGRSSSSSPVKFDRNHRQRKGHALERSDSRGYKEPSRSLGGLGVVTPPVGTPEDSPQQSPSKPRGSLRSRNSISALPVLEEEPLLQGVTRGLTMDDPNRDSALVTDSPMHLQAPFKGADRDSGVYLGDKPKPQPSATDNAIAQLSWPVIDEEKQTIDLKQWRKKPEVLDLLPSQAKPYSRNASPSPAPKSTSLGSVRLAAANIEAQAARRPSREFPLRPKSSQSQKSGANIGRQRTPDVSAAGALKVEKPEVRGRGTNERSLSPPLRRTDRQLPTNLGSSSHQSLNNLAKEADLSRGSVATTPTPEINKSIKRDTPGQVRARDMADVYDGFGQGRIGSPISPTRPHSMRRRQSMQVLDLEAKVEQLATENRMLSDSKSQIEQNFERSQHATAALADRDAEIDSLKATIDWLHREVSRLTEVNEGLTSANVTMGNQHNERYNMLETQHSQTLRELQASREAASVNESRMQIDDTLQDKDREIAQLLGELEAAKAQIREMQQQILASKAVDGGFLVVRDEDYFDNACQELCQHVQHWVLRFSKYSDMRACRLTAEINNEKIVDRLDNAILDGSNIDVYLADRVKRRDVLMSMTMTMIWDFVFTRYLFGMDREQRQKLKQLEKMLTEVGPPAAVQQWRATTLTLLSKRQAFLQQREQDIEAVVHEIFQTLSEILPPPTQMEEPIQAQLRKVIKYAVGLSIEMRTQRAEYMMLPPLQPEYDANGDLVQKVSFNAALMNERSGDTVSNEELEEQGAVVRIVLFPLVVKKGDDRGEGDEEIVVCPAQVLVAKPKKTVRVFSPDSAQYNQSRVSMQSSMPTEYMETPNVTNSRQVSPF